MALWGERIGVPDETTVRVDPVERTIQTCEGQFGNGTRYEFRDGVPFVKGLSAGSDFVQANADQVRQITGALATQYGRGRLVEKPGGRWALLETAPMDPIAKAVADARKSGAKKLREALGTGIAEARDYGLVSTARRLLEDEGKGTAEVLGDLRRDFSSIPEIEELSEVALREARNQKGNLAYAQKIVKENGLVAEVRTRLGQGETEVEVHAALEKDLESYDGPNGIKIQCSEKEVEEIVNLAMVEGAIKLAADQKKAAAQRKKRNRQNRWDSYVPGTKEFAWDELIRKQGLLSTIRFLRSMGLEDDTIETRLKGELEQHGIPRAEEIIDYAFHRSEDEAFQKNAAKRYITDRELDAVVDRALRLGENRNDIQSRLKQVMDADNRDPAEVKQILDAAFERADAHRRKMRIKSGLKSILPLTGEFAWDNFLIDKGIHTKIRKLIAAGKSPFEIRNELIKDPELEHHSKQDAIIEYALDTHETILVKQAYRTVKTKNLAAKVLELQGQNPALAATAIEAQIKALITGDPEQEEVDAIVAAAFEEAKSLKNRKKAVELLKTPFTKTVDAAKWTGRKVRDTVVPGLLKTPGAIWDAPGKLYNWGKENPDTVKTVAKYGALGIAIAGISTAAVGVGALVLGGYALKKAAPLAFNVGKHLVVDGATVVQAVGQTVLVNPIKAAGRIVSTPFKRGYQAARWASDYITKPSIKKPKGWTKPFTWMNNALKKTWYRSKQASLGLAAASLFSIYGAGEGLANAASKDLLGLNAEIPELSIFHAPAGGHDHGGHGHDPNADHDEPEAPHGGAHAPAAAHGGGHH